MMYQAIARHLLEFLILAGSLGFIEIGPVYGQVAGEQAPAFSLESVSGETYSLDQFRGEYVVLEWMNFRCRTVDELYKNQTLPAMQASLREEGVVWLSIVSEASGKQGQVSPEKMQQQIEKRGGKQEAVLIDATGAVGQTYGARVSPHMVVVDPEGKMIYQGALDNQPRGNPVDGEPAINYVTTALRQSMQGEEVAFAVTEAYGCEIRYER